MEGGWFRDNLIELFSMEGLEIMPFWRWWSVAVKTAPAILYGDYVRNHEDLFIAYNEYVDTRGKVRLKFLNSSQTIGQWGKFHYEEFGKAEGRTLSGDSVAIKVVPGDTLIVGMNLKNFPSIFARY